MLAKNSKCLGRLKGCMVRVWHREKQEVAAKLLKWLLQKRRFNHRPGSVSSLKEEQRIFVTPDQLWWELHFTCKLSPKLRPRCWPWSLCIKAKPGRADDHRGSFFKKVLPCWFYLSSFGSLFLKVTCGLLALFCRRCWECCSSTVSWETLQSFTFKRTSDGGESAKIFFSE